MLLSSVTGKLLHWVLKGLIWPLKMSWPSKTDRLLWQYNLGHGLYAVLWVINYICVPHSDIVVVENKCGIQSPSCTWVKRTVCWLIKGWRQNSPVKGTKIMRRGLESAKLPVFQTIKVPVQTGMGTPHHHFPQNLILTWSTFQSKWNVAFWSSFATSSSVPSPCQALWNSVHDRDRTSSGLSS